MRALDLAGISVNVDQSTHPIYEKLVSRAAQNAEDYPFATMKDLFMFAACVGASRGIYEEINRNKDIFSGETFKKEVDVPILAALAYQKENSFDVLFEPKSVIEIAQGWANGGIRIVQEELLQNPALTPLDNLVEIISEELELHLGDE